jgi:hypothetical protein
MAGDFKFTRTFFIHLCFRSVAEMISAAKMISLSMEYLINEYLKQ